MSLQKFEATYSGDEVEEAYDMIDRFLRNNLDDLAYQEYSEALEIVYNYKKD